MATTPLWTIEAMGANSRPSRFFEIAPVGSTCTLAVSRARSLIQVMVLGLSATGTVLGMQTTVVNPPAAAARAPDSDETAWLEPMADLIRHGQWGDLDYPHLGEYLSDMARRDRREVESRLATLLAHVLKWLQQPEHRTRGWRGTMVEQRQELARLTARGVLRNHAEAVLS